VFGLFVVQAVVAARAEFAPDEAYYLLWSQHLAWGYYDHPPMVAGWIALSRALFGDSEFGARALGLVASLGGAAAVWRIAFVLFGTTRTAWFATLLFAAPILLDAGAIIATPDIPLVFFWTLGLLALAEIYRGAGAWAWLLLGLSLGAACLSKFTGAFFGAGAGLAFFATPSLWPWLKRWPPYAAALLALIVLAPFLAWSANHGWITFAKQLSRVPPQGFTPEFMLEFVGAQAALLNPLVAALAIASLARTRSREGEATRLLWLTVTPALLYFAFHATHARVEGNWLAPLYPAFVVLAAATAANASFGWRRLAALAATPLGLLVTFIAAMQVLAGPFPMGARDPTLRLAGWRELATDVVAAAQANKANFVLTQGYALTSEMKVYGKTSLPIEQPDERARWSASPPPPADAFGNGTGLALARQGTGFEALLKSRFASVVPLDALARKRAKTRVEVFDLWLVSAPLGPVLTGP
jgi:4-amino-4-deoxy-L-arabinose transferase-like glycosyltransferase